MRVPNAVVQNRPSPFPAGTYFGKIQEVNDRRNEDETWIMLTIVFNEVTPADDDSPEVGARPYRFRPTIVNNGVAIWDIEEFTEDTDFRLRQSAGLLAQLALALGAAKVLSNQDVDFDAESFCDDLIGEVFVGEEVMVTVNNRPYKARDGSDRVDDGPSAFAALDEGEEEVEEVDEVEDEDTEEEEEEEEESPKPRPRKITKRK